ncbi:MAG: VCBS repeat-containing protein, partial [Candidatus Heimdallarchaeota archaeon]|nr:VCBS repeat-containing protein [Candidatus Heimdallarchaeota archaeon]
EGKKIVLGTSDGKIIMFEYEASTHSYNLLWNSYTNDSYTQGTNIWDIVEVQSPGKIPTWLFNSTESPILRNDWEEHVPLDGPDPQAKIREFEVNNTLPLGYYGDFASVSHVSLFSAFFEAIFNEVPAFEPFKDIVELHIPENDMVIGTTNGKLLVIPELTHEISPLANYFFAPTNTNPFYNGMSISPTFVDFNNDANYFPEVMLLGWAGNLEGQLYNPELGNTAVAGLDVYTYDPLVGPLGMYTGKFELKDLEITGLLDRALEKSRKMPEVAVGDMDGDGDQDIVLTNGRIYYIENINNALFVLSPEYFQDLILQATDKLFDSPELYDFDGDGDLDLTVGWSNLKGTIVSTTYYENVGYRWAPQWEENKWLYTNSWGGLRFNNLTHAAFAYDQNDMVSHLTTYNTHTRQLIQLQAEYDNHNAFVIGTNPIIARLEINLKSGTDSHLNPLENYGYHVFETWTSEAELNHWTLALKTGDMDQDGRKEVIIGDFDNNLYVFEHLTNNTYKRAFRSQDITHTELSTTSPYAWDQLEGVSGTFYRTVWDHIEEIVVGLDMDNDGFLEMVATAGLSIFVWEQTNNGFVSIDDEYTLIWQADLRQSAWAPLFADLGISSFTAAAYGGDIDFNGFGEFILAAGSFLFVFESNGADSFYENFLVNPFPVRGRYFIPGNPLSSPAVRTLSIESIVVADTDNDTFNEIIIGGVNKTWWGQYNGFVAILENQIGTYAYTWWAPQRTMEDNPVYDIVVD